MDAAPADASEKPEGDWRLWDYEDSLQRGAFVIFLMLVTLLLMLTGFKHCSVIVFVFCVIFLCTRIGIDMSEEKCPPFETTSKRCYVKGGSQCCCCWMFTMLLPLCRATYTYLTYSNPFTSVRGLGVERLAEVYARSPESYSVVLKDGWVNKDDAGYFKDSRHSKMFLKGTGLRWEDVDETHYFAAPIYKDSASGSGAPYAWAVAKNVGREPKAFEATYCEGAGVCGVLAGLVSDPKEGSILSMFDASHLDAHGWFRAAEIAARRGGFSFPEGLPALEMKEVAKIVKGTEDKYSKFPFYLLGFLIFCIIGELDSFIFLRWYLKVEGVPEEQQPLVPEDFKYEGFYALRSRMVAAERKLEIEKKKWFNSDIKAAEQELQEAKTAFFAQAASEGDRVRCVIDDGDMKQDQCGFVTLTEHPAMAANLSLVATDDQHLHRVWLKNLAVVSKATPLGIGDRVKANVSLEKGCAASGGKFKCSPGDMGTVSGKSSPGTFDVTWDKHEQQPPLVTRHQVDIVQKATAMDLPDK